MLDIQVLLFMFSDVSQASFCDCCNKIVREGEELVNSFLAHQLMRSEPYPRTGMVCLRILSIVEFIIISAIFYVIEPKNICIVTWIIVSAMYLSFELDL